MTIGEQIIAAIDSGELLAYEKYLSMTFGRPVLRWKPPAADQLTALVHAHVEAEVTRRMELKVLGTDTAFKALPPIRATD